jgi:hypothetical protein
LCDPSKAQADDPKYRQLKLDNPKLQRTLDKFPATLFYLQAIGFARNNNNNNNNENEMLLSIPLTTVSNAASLLRITTACKELEIALERLRPSTTATTCAATLATATNKATDITSASTSTTSNKLAVLERAKLREQANDKKAREATLKLIQQDKLVRQKDDNWTSQPSAACAKTGSSILTFRDRHGE